MKRKPIKPLLRAAAGAIHRLHLRSYEVYQPVVTESGYALGVRDCEVRWEATQKRFVCPLHGASFAATGKDPRGAARTPLASFPAQLKGTTVQLDTSRVSVSATPTKGRGKGEHDDDDDEHEGERR